MVGGEGVGVGRPGEEESVAELEGLELAGHQAVEGTAEEAPLKTRNNIKFPGKKRYFFRTLKLFSAIPAGHRSMSAGVSYTVLNCCHTCNEETNICLHIFPGKMWELFSSLTSSSISSGALSHEHALGSPQNSLKSL